MIGKRAPKIADCTLEIRAFGAEPRPLTRTRAKNLGVGGKIQKKFLLGVHFRRQGRGHFTDFVEEGCYTCLLFFFFFFGDGLSRHTRFRLRRAADRGRKQNPENSCTNGNTRTCGVRALPGSSGGENGGSRPRNTSGGAKIVARATSLSRTSRGAGKSARTKTADPLVSLRDCVRD